MSRLSKPWWNKQKKAWCTEIGGKRRTLAKGRGNWCQAQAKLKAILQGQELLSEFAGAISVTRLCEEFLTDAQENLEPKTYESYQFEL